VSEPSLNLTPLKLQTHKCAKCGQMIHLLHGGRERQRLLVVTNLAIALSTIEIGVEEGASAAETCPLPEDDKRGEDDKRKEVQRDQQTASTLAYKRPVVYGLKINPYKSHGLKNPCNYRDYRP
jgi:hypothetical protein